MNFKVVNLLPLPGVDFGDQLLEPLGATLVKRMSQTEDEILNIAKDADAVIGVPSFHPFNRSTLEGLSNCRIVAGIGIGYDQTDLEAATELGIAVTTVPDYCLDEVSSFAITLILALGHKLIKLDKAVREKQIVFTNDREALMERAYPILRMRDQTLGIIGLGKIGTATALKARGLGMRVIAHDPYVLGAVMETHGVTPVDLNTLLSESDFISIHTPLTSETKNLMGYEEFKKMKRTSYFINTARGGCVDQQALVQALQQGIIAGAGIDVTVDEPISPDSPLLELPNVILTGHIAWYSTKSEGELYGKPMTQVVRALNGKWPLYVVNTEVKERWIKKWGKRF
jgi:D-3-phosphoglycerate dehydrogenase